MANEIAIGISFTCNNGYMRDQYSPGQIQVTQANVGRAGHVQNVGTTEEVLDFGDINTNGYIILRNLSETNYVTYGPEESGAMVVVGKLKPGEIAILRVAPTVVMRAQAENTSSADYAFLEVRLYED